MHPLRANLKQLYQRRTVLLIYGVIGVFTALIVVGDLFDARPREGEFAGLLLLLFPIGLVVAAMQMETLSKPFSFRLPHHHNVIRKLITVIGLTVSLLFSLPFAKYPGLFDTSPVWWGLVLCSAFCANLMVYMASVVMGFTLRNAIGWLCFFPVGLVLVRMVHLSVGVERTIIQRPLTVIGITGVLATAGWWWLGRPAWFRRRAGRYWTDLFGLWDRSQMQGYRQFKEVGRSRKTMSPTVDRFFLHAISAHGLSDLRRHVWGALYPTCVLILPQWKGLVLVVLLGAVWGGYEPSIAPAAIGVIPLMMAGFLRSPIRSKQLVAGGRRERLLVTVALMLGLGTASVLVVGMAVALTHLLAPLVPTLEFKGIVLDLQPVRLAVLWVPLVVFPFATLAKILFYRNPAWLSAAMGTIFVSTFMFALPLGRHVTVAPATSTVGVIVLWMLCLAAMCRIAMRSDLVRR